MKEDVLKFIKEHKECVLATVSPSGQPEAAIILFAVTGDLVFYFGTKKEYRKFSNISKDKRVALVVGTSGSDPRTVQAEGEIEILDSESGAAEAKEVLKTNPAMVPFLDLPLVYLRLKPNWLRFLDETKGGTDNFEQII